MHKHSIAATLVFSIIGFLMFFAGDCALSDKNENLPVVTSIGAPSNVTIKLDQTTGCYVEISWQASAHQSRTDFKGYVINTYEVDSANAIKSLFSSVTTDKNASSQTIISLIPLKKYISYIHAQLKDSVRSDSVGTKIYAPVFANNDVIDEYLPSGNGNSGYGWNTTFGVGTRYAYTSNNAQLIDLHLRGDATGLRFYSPDQQTPGVKTTLMGIIGTGQTAFDLTELVEPDSKNQVVMENTVYLLKLSSRNYVKIWVTKINMAGNGKNYKSVEFKYKLQPISGLRMVKK
ncbi:MAG: hypothetical protein Q8903_14115 [Bacteroidota bacterium]|nr:hypothetical protein [Bacteroidota bacterium]